MKFDSEFGWTTTKSGPIKLADLPIEYTKFFQWPKDAIQKANDLIKNGFTPDRAIQTISSTLER